MPTPTRAKPPVPAWIIRERKRLGLKPRDLAERLSAMGLGVTEGTVRTWEAGRNPHPDNVEGLERIFETRAPGSPEAGADQSALIAALAAQTQAIAAQTAAMLELVEAMREARDRNQDASASMIRATEVFLSRVRLPEAEGSSGQREPADVRR